MTKDEFSKKFEQAYSSLGSNYKQFNVYKAFRNNTGSHPESYQDIECSFAASCLKKTRPARILDIGSYRKFVLGMLAAYEVATLDIRPRNYRVAGEESRVGDAKNLPFESASFDAVTSLCAIEHFGLGRYGDEIDLAADEKAALEISRVLKPGGHYIFTTTIKKGTPSLVFNAHRIYSYDLIMRLTEGMSLVEEEYFSNRTGTLCSFEDITDADTEWDMYMACWRKNLV